MNDDTSMMFLAKEGDSGKAFALLATVVVLGLAFHAYSFMVVKENDILSKYNIQEYSISFEESSLQDSDSVLIGDGETETKRRCYNELWLNGFDICESPYTISKPYTIQKCDPIQFSKVISIV